MFFSPAVHGLIWADAAADRGVVDVVTEYSTMIRKKKNSENHHLKSKQMVFQMVCS
jgi:hypothetical protein